jgi:hypothetical protein
MDDDGSPATPCVACPVDTFAPASGSIECLPCAAELGFTTDGQTGQLTCEAPGICIIANADGDSASGWFGTSLTSTLTCAAFGYGYGCTDDDICSCVDQNRFSEDDCVNSSPWAYATWFVGEQPCMATSWTFHLTPDDTDGFGEVYLSVSNDVGTAHVENVLFAAPEGETMCAVPQYECENFNSWNGDDTALGCTYALCQQYGYGFMAADTVNDAACIGWQTDQWDCENSWGWDWVTSVSNAPVQQDLCLPPSLCFSITAEGTSSSTWQILDTEGTELAAGSVPFNGDVCI